MEFDGVEYARRLGNAECDWVKPAKLFGKKTTACQFSSPGGLEVKTKRGVYQFMPGYGKPATVTIVDDVPQCVLAASNTVAGVLKAAQEK